MTRYHPLLVALHWLLALVIIVALFTGGFFLTEIPNTDPAKIDALRTHMLVGMVITVLTLVRLTTRVITQRPPRADIGNPALNRLGAAMHWLLYILVLAMGLSGIAMSGMAGLPDIVMGASGEPLPSSFHIYPPRAVHGIVASLLGLLIAGHIGAFAYHQFVRKDGLIRRMWFGKRTG